MFDFISVLEENPNGVMATYDGERVKTRVFRYLFSYGNKTYFCTNSEKTVYNQILKNPHVSFCTYGKNFSVVVSVNGEAVFIENMELKKKVFDENPNIKIIFEKLDNPTFKLFYINAEEIQMFSFDKGSSVYRFC